ncbi:MAG: response regulator [Betaproteobacteria bacterium]|nr:response regulator [Betaproteobacteria bacterium]
MNVRRDRPCIAVVDDDGSVREAIAGLLKSAGFSAETFATAEEFLRSRRAKRAASMIVDVHLPGMSGLELQRHLSARGRDIPSVVISAHADSAGELRTQALAAGALAMLPKPFGDEDLLEAVRSALRKRGERLQAGDRSEASSSGTRKGGKN